MCWGCESCAVASLTWLHDSISVRVCVIFVRVCGAALGHSWVVIAGNGWGAGVLDERGAGRKQMI